MLGVVFFSYQSVVVLGLLFLMAVSPLLTVFGFLSGRAATVSTGYVFLLLGLGLHLVFCRARTSATSEGDSIHQDIFEIAFLTHSLMMEKTYTCEGHCDTIFVAGHDDMIVTHTAASLGDELHATLVGALNVVAEGEEGIRA